MTRSNQVSRLGSRWWFGWLALAGVLIVSCAKPSRPLDTTMPSTPPRDLAETRPVSEPESSLPLAPRLQRDGLKRRLKGVVTCLEKARETVVAAEIAGASIEAVRPAIDALSRAEVALREAQSHLIRGADAQTVSPLERAEFECRTVLAGGHS